MMANYKCLYLKLNLCAIVLVFQNPITFGVQEDTIFVNSNGVLSFRTEFSLPFIGPFPLPSFRNNILIAPFGEDIDITTAGDIFYRFTTDESLLGEVGDNISNAFEVNFEPTSLFIVTWDRVARFSGSAFIVNTFQVVLATDGFSTYVMFLYGNLQWGRDQQFGINNIGFNAGDGIRGFTLDLSLADLQEGSNVGPEYPGVYMFRIDLRNVLVPGQEFVSGSSISASGSGFGSGLSGSATGSASGSGSGSALQIDDHLLPFGLTAGDQILPSFDDGSSPPQYKSTSCPIFGVQQDTIYVNSNGILSFSTGFTTFISERFPLPRAHFNFTSDIIIPLIAPFWDDVNINTAGDIFYRFTTDEYLLVEVGSDISSAFEVNFVPTLLFIATWDRVARFGGSPSIVNTFQAVLATDGFSTYVMFLYRDMQWGSMFSSTIGFDAGDGIRGYNLDFTSITALQEGSNVGPEYPGVYMFRVDLENVLVPRQVSGSGISASGSGFGSGISASGSGFGSGVSGSGAVDSTVVEFEQPEYEVLEDIGLENLALRVCFKIDNLTSDRSVRLRTLQGTAEEDEDYIALDIDLLLRLGDQRKCVAIIILEDSMAEEDETFGVVIDELGVATTIVILDDDDLSFSYIGNSPMVIGDTVYFDLSLGNAFTAARCALLIGNRVQNETDCSLGKANMILSRARNSEYTPQVTLVRSNGAETVITSEDRNIRLGVRGRCSVHLINDGIFVATNADRSAATAISWGLSAPSDVIRSQVGFTCSLDAGPAFNCTSPFLVEGEAGSIRVNPTSTGGCMFVIGRTFNL